jgi:lysozyme family protein
MTARFKAAFDILVAHEGGFNDIPADRGGATNLGVSLRFLQSRGTVYDFNRDGVVDAADVRMITRDDAMQIYLMQYWDPVHCNEMPNGLALALFDASVNSGPAQAVRWLQQALGVTVDGICGPATVKAAQKAGPDVLQRFHLLRMRAMTRMEGWPSFGRGWSVRMVQVAFQAQTFA